mgnify:CR=1 FL=1
MEQEALIFTDAAAMKVGSLLADEDNSKMNLRVYVTGGGCSGFQYGFSFDENKDGVDELLIPFATGGVYVLAYADGGLTFTESKLSKADLFGMKSSAGEAEINSAILARIENGLYDSVLKSDQNKNLDSLLFLVTDTLLLGDTLNLFVLPDSASDFFCLLPVPVSSSSV